MDESYEITLRNHRNEPVQIRVVEHMYRWTNWRLTAHSQPFNKTDAHIAEFLVDVPADSERSITYKVRYSW